MSGQHYVSRFHLSAFCDPESTGTTNPWVWLGTVTDGAVKRRSPKNVGTVASLFDGAAGFADPETSIETFLANEVEGPASKALRDMIGRGHKFSQLPSEIMRYLAWAASRSLPMQRLGGEWAVRFDTLLKSQAEPPPAGLAEVKARVRLVRLIHPATGDQKVVEGKEADALLDAGWIPDFSEPSNFLEGAHIQAYYFRARWFPRLLWFTLRPPDGEFFIIGDRPVGWGVPDCLDAPPCCLRDPSAFLIAPLSHSLALVGRNNSEAWAVTPAQINAMLAVWSHVWIAGPKASVVADALRARDTVMKPTLLH